MYHNYNSIDFNNPSPNYYSFDLLLSPQHSSEQKKKKRRRRRYDTKKEEEGLP